MWKIGKVESMLRKMTRSLFVQYSNVAVWFDLFAISWASSAPSSNIWTAAAIAGCDHNSKVVRLYALIKSVNLKIAKLASFEKLTEPETHKFIKSTLSDRSMSWTTKRSLDIHSFILISNDVHENRKWCAHSKALRHNGQVGFSVKLKVKRSPRSLSLISYEST